MIKIEFLIELRPRRTFAPVIIGTILNFYEQLMVDIGNVATEGSLIWPGTLVVV